MNDNKPKVIVTGAAGFIGSSLVKKLLNDNFNVLGIDNLNEYYDINLKLERLKNIESYDRSKLLWKFHKISLSNLKDLDFIFNEFRPDIVVNLAAQAGVRYSISNPRSYIDSNLIGFYNILELCRKFEIRNFIYASSSSVYGVSDKEKFYEDDSINKPISLYAATKGSNELMAYSYSSLYKIPSIGLRLFTVYGPWGRPDMAPMIFANAILSGEKINVFNNGNMERDFTYIDDVTEIIKRCCLKSSSELVSKSTLNEVPHNIFNIGNSNPVNLMEFIKILESILGKKAFLEFQPLQKGDVIRTFADNQKIVDWIDFYPNTNIEKGIKKFADWYLDFYGK